jgi:hypothetical protein
MRKVHAQFHGQRGSFLQLGDSITDTRAFWTPLQYARKNAPPAMEKAYARVKAYMAPEWWDRKGAEYGSQSGQTIVWAQEHLDGWLKRFNPEVALVMFGTNDLSQREAPDYGARLRDVVRRCLAAGTVPVVSTIPPRSHMVEKAAQFADAARRVARELAVPLEDFHREILARRPDDWDGSLPQFRAEPGDDYQVDTLIARDGVHPSNPAKYNGDYSTAGLRSSGYVLRNYLTLMTYAEVIGRVLDPAR